MADGLPDRTLATESIERLVRAIRPAWRVEESSLAEAGYTAVYHLTAETPDGSRECVLKASPDGDRHGIDTEARLLGVLGEHTALPVPRVLGAVDAHDDLRAPFFVMESLPGAAVRRRNIGSLSERVLERIAEETGSYLAELHALDAVDGFGVVDCDRSRPLSGTPPAGDVGGLVVTESDDSWPAVLRARIAETLSTHETTRFADRTPAIRTALRAGVDALSEGFAPALGRVDHGLHNLGIDAETGEIEAMLDWGFTLAVPPAYDFVCVEHVLGASVWSTLPRVPDRRDVVAEAMATGYRSVTGSLPRGLDEGRTLYELLAYVRSMNHVEAGLAAAARDGPTDVVADGLRARVDSLVERTR